MGISDRTECKIGCNLSHVLLDFGEANSDIYNAFLKFVSQVASFWQQVIILVVSKEILESNITRLTEVVNCFAVSKLDKMGPTPYH